MNKSIITQLAEEIAESLSLDDIKNQILEQARTLFLGKMSNEELEAIKAEITTKLVSNPTPPPAPTQEIAEQIPTGIEEYDDDPATAQIIPVTLETVIIPGVSHVQQADARWKTLEMGNIGHTGSTIGRVGCGLAALTALAIYYLKVQALTPPILNKFLAMNDGYDKNNNLRWDTICKLFQRWGLQATFDQTRCGDIDSQTALERRVVTEIDSDRPALLRVRHSKGPHFLLAVGYIQNSNGIAEDFITMDPGTYKGDPYGAPACTLYGNANHEFALEGCLVYHVTGTPVNPNPPRPQV